MKETTPALPFIRSGASRDPSSEIPLLFKEGITGGCLWILLSKKWPFHHCVIKGH
jgi:hypothetical protein